MKAIYQGKVRECYQKTAEVNEKLHSGGQVQIFCFGKNYLSSDAHDIFSSGDYDASGSWLAEASYAVAYSEEGSEISLEDAEKMVYQKVGMESYGSNKYVIDGKIFFCVGGDVLHEMQRRGRDIELISAVLETQKAFHPNIIRGVRNPYSIDDVSLHGITSHKAPHQVRAMGSEYAVLCGYVSLLEHAMSSEDPVDDMCVLLSLSAQLEELGYHIFTFEEIASLWMKHKKDVEDALGIESYDYIPYIFRDKRVREHIFGALINIAFVDDIKTQTDSVSRKEPRFFLLMTSGARKSRENFEDTVDAFNSFQRLYKKLVIDGDTEEYLRSSSSERREEKFYAVWKQGVKYKQRFDAFLRMRNVGGDASGLAELLDEGSLDDHYTAVTWGASLLDEPKKLEKIREVEDRYWGVLTLSPTTIVGQHRPCDLHALMNDIARAEDIDLRDLVENTGLERAVRIDGKLRRANTRIPEPWKIVQVASKDLTYLVALLLDSLPPRDVLDILVHMVGQEGKRGKPMSMAHWRRFIKAYRDEEGFSEYPLEWAVELVSRRRTMG